MDNDPDPCKFGYIVIYMYYDWIKKIVDSETSTSEFEIQCRFEVDLYQDYTCYVEISPETSSESLFTSAKGKHKKSYGDHKVRKTVIKNCPSLYFPTLAGFVFENLEKLVINGGKIEFISRKNFIGLRNLLELDIYDNPIKRIPQKAFDNLLSLEIFAISKTKIRTFHVDLFVNQTKLNYLFATSNLITHINTKLFRNNLELEEIDLRNNEIISIEGKFAFLPSLKTLLLENNKCINQNLHGGQKVQLTSITKIDDDLKLKCIENFHPNKIEQN